MLGYGMGVGSDFVLKLGHAGSVLWAAKILTTTT